MIGVAPERGRMVSAVIGIVVRRALAGREEQAAVASEPKAADRVRQRARERTVAPAHAHQHGARRVVDRVRVGRAHRVAHQPSERERVRVDAVRVRVGREQEVHEMVGDVVGIDGHSEQAAVALVEHLVLALEERRRRACAVRHRPHVAALLGDEHAAPGQERDRRRRVERDVGDGVFRDEVRRQGLRRGGDRGGKDGPEDSRRQPDAQEVTRRSPRSADSNHEDVSQVGAEESRSAGGGCATMVDGGPDVGKFTIALRRPVERPERLRPRRDARRRGARGLPRTLAPSGPCRR